MQGKISISFEWFKKNNQNSNENIDKEHVEHLALVAEEIISKELSKGHTEGDLSETVCDSIINPIDYRGTWSSRTEITTFN